MHVNPALDDEGFAAALATALAMFDKHQPQVAVTMNSEAVMRLQIRQEEMAENRKSAIDKNFKAKAWIMKNSIFVIKPYKWEGMWVFDDRNVGLVKEPFVGGADMMIDRATAHIPNANQGFIAVFSAGYFPGSQILLEWDREEGGGNVYRWNDEEMEGWLCPALFKYFEQPPQKLYIQVKAAA